jgi:hypothetical protein
MKKILFVGLALVIVLAGAVMGCGGSDGNGTSTATNTQSQQGQPTQVSENEGGVNFSGDQDWKISDIPEYPRAEFVYQIRGEEPGDPPVIVENEIFVTDDSIDEVRDFYRAGMADNGWEEVYWGDFTGGHMGSFTKPGDIGASVGIATTNEGNVMITLDKRYPKS